MGLGQSCSVFVSGGLPRCILTFPFLSFTIISTHPSIFPLSALLM